MTKEEWIEKCKDRMIKRYRELSRGGWAIGGLRLPELNVKFQVIAEELAEIKFEPRSPQKPTVYK